jgi:hypothetical protein
MQATAAPRPAHRPRLGYELFAILCAKAVALGVLYFVFFGADHRIPTARRDVSAHLVGESAR